MSEPPFGAWLEGLSPERREQAQSMARAFMAFGNTQEDAERFTQTDKTTPFPAFALFSLLHAVWQKIDGWRGGDDIGHMVRAGAERHNDPFSDADQAAARIIGAGASLADLEIFARGIAYNASFDVLNIVDGTYHPRQDDSIGWDLVEYDPDRLGPPRPIGPLHEALLRRDPSGREGRPE